MKHLIDNALGFLPRLSAAHRPSLVALDDFIHGNTHELFIMALHLRETFPFAGYILYIVFIIAVARRTTSTSRPAARLVSSPLPLYFSCLSCHDCIG